MADPAKFREAGVRACLALLFNSYFDRSSADDVVVLRKSLKEPIWCVTGTFDVGSKAKGCPKFSEAAAAEFTKGSDWERQVRFDHVVRIKTITDRLLSAREEIDVRRVFEETPTCVVTKDEHTKLTKQDRKDPKVEGWERYRKLGINVIAGPHVRIVEGQIVS